MKLYTSRRVVREEATQLFQVDTDVVCLSITGIRNFVIDGCS